MLVLVCHGFGSNLWSLFWLMWRLKATPQTLHTNS